MSTKSLSDRKKSFLEDCASCGPTMSMGDAGYQSDAPAAGPMAGYDQPLGKKKKLLDTVKRLKRK